MNLSANGKLLLLATKELSRKWTATKSSWRDARAGEFEQGYLSELFAGVDRSGEVFDQLEKVLNKIKMDCE